MLKMMDLPRPEAMTGQSLFECCLTQTCIGNRYAAL